MDLALSLVTIAVGVAAIVMTAGAATPLVVGAFVVGSGAVAYGASNLYEAGHNIYLGSVGDGLTVATNPLRDTLFMGNDRLYHQIGGLFTTASAVMIPIGQTKSVAKGLTEFTIGEVGGFIGGQASYHGTRLLGGSEQDAQRAILVGNILAGYAASSAARRFSLNEPIAARVTKPTYNHQQLLKNLENSRLARQSSRFKSYVAREKLVGLKTAIARKVKGFNPEIASTKQKGNFGEIMADANLSKPIQGDRVTYNLRRVGRDVPRSLDTRLEKGIDGIYINEADGPSVVINEAKYGSSTLNPKTSDGKQMNRDWIENRIIETNFENLEDYLKVRNAMRQGDYDSVLSKVDAKGNVHHYRLDEDANIISDWP
ncbi:hypothetical protein [Streptococcus equi]|uniref:hypothetical protein n=1 Tax=Streptococcus equi TaxID=1336 RepID=UPI001E38C75A